MPPLMTATTADHPPRGTKSPTRITWARIRSSNGTAGGGTILMKTEDSNKYQGEVTVLWPKEGVVSIIIIKSVSPK